VEYKEVIGNLAYLVTYCGLPNVLVQGMPGALRPTSDRWVRKPESAEVQALHYLRLESSPCDSLLGK
jgi:hypothetical protein